MRELRVEDALLYLDQVKVEFGDRPHIYNEFLEIMKTFKTQQIDTPGVIRRVSNLFRGNRRLVLGFNTFLPEGYQIELPPDGEGPPVAVYRAPGSNITQVLQESSESQAHQVGLGNPPMGQQQSMPPPHAGQQPPMHHVPPAHGHPGMRGPPPSQSAMQHSQPVGGGGQLMMPHDSQPGMQARPPQHSMDQRVQQQQQQPQQLPGGRPQPLQQQQQQQMPPHDGKMPPGGPRPPHMQGAAAPPPPPHMNGQGGVMRGGPPGQQQAGMGPPPPGYADPNALSPQQATSASPPQQQQPLEFDHAINYVTTIKKRFSSQPETYKKFLEILHTYQKEQRGIKEVLEEVSSLFADHPDLLKEFTYFLPDAVQAQAKAQLEQAAKEAEARKRERTKQASVMQQSVKAGMPRGPGRALDYDRNAIHVPFGAMQGRTEEQENLIIRNAHYGVVSFDPVRPPRRNELTPVQAATKNGRPTAIPELPIQPNTAETAFFQKVRDHLERRELQSERQLGSRRHTPYVEFLKCLHLFGAGVVNRDELLQLLKTLFSSGHAPKSSSSSREMVSISHTAQDLLREFEEILTGRGPFAAQEAALKEKSKYGAMRVRDFDFSNTDHPTPSYFAYPSDYPKSLFLNNPGQSQTDSEVLNDDVVCVGAEKGKVPSVEDYDGVRVRHNAYEEMMFRIEDERYELDLAIERNAHALQQIEPLAEEVQALRDREEKDGQPIGRLQYRLNRLALNSIHINAIARIYGEKGDEVLQHLSRNPLVVLPIVYQRLKQKDAEWRKLQADLNPKWAKACEDSYEGTLDVLCYFKRRDLERRAAPARLRDDCIHAGSYYRHPDRLKKDDDSAEPFQPTFGLRLDDPGAVLYQPFVKVACHPGGASHKDAFELVTAYIRANSQISALDRERIGRIWAEFITPWFGFPAHWVVDEVHQSFSGRMTPNVVKFALGQRVFTLFGEGTIGSVVKEDNNGGIKYRVKLSFGTAYVGPTAILYAIPSTDAPFVRRDGIMARDESVFDTNMGSPQLDEKHQLLFGTESIYLFLRLYSFLCSVLTDTREHCATFPPSRDPALSYFTLNRDRADTPVDFSSTICALKLVLSKRMDPKRFEALGRRLSKEKVHQLAALPKLVERCASYLIKVAKEDALLHLYDFCNHRAADPVVVREHCFTVAPDVNYRIQYQNSTGELYFSHLPKGETLLTAPSDDIKSFSDEEAGENPLPMEEDDDYDHIEEYDDTNGGLPALKRQKLK